MLRSSVRTFSTQSRVLANYGFVGLGLMGQHMARHIYNNLKPVDKLYVHDVNPQHTSDFITQVTSQNHIMLLN